MAFLIQPLRQVGGCFAIVFDDQVLRPIFLQILRKTLLRGVRTAPGSRERRRTVGDERELVTSVLAAVFTAAMWFLAWFLAASLAAFFSDFATLASALVIAVAMVGAAQGCRTRRAKREVHVSWKKSSIDKSKLRPSSWPSRLGIVAPTVEGALNCVHHQTRICVRPGRR